VVLGGVSLLALVAAGPAARAQTLGPLIQVTGKSIFADCTADRIASQPGTVYLNTEVEPNLAIDPADTSNLLFGVQQDRWNNGGSRGLRGGVSTDGGSTFTPTSTPGVTKCQGGPWPRSSDPWVTFSPDGTSYMSALVVKESADPRKLASASGQVVSQSKDGGMTWGPPITLISDFDPNTLDDKNSITADPRNSSFVYTVWDRLTQFVDGYGVADEGSGGSQNGIMQGGNDGTDLAHHMRDHARAVAAGKGTPNSKTLVIGPTYFSRTTNGGASWSLPKIIWNPGSNSQTIANQIVPLRKNRIADFFTELQDNTNGQPSRIGSVVSDDHGGTWSSPNYAQSQVNNKATTPNMLQPIRSADVLFAIASDVQRGLVYLVWEDSRFTGDDEVAFAFSPDSGFEWTAPVRINQTPRNPAGGSGYFQQALIPTVAVAADGTAVVTYYDFRNDPVGATSDNADFWAVSCNVFTSPDNCLSNGDWASEQRLTNTSFNFDYAPLTSSGRFLGDYMTMKSVGQTIYTIFGQSPKQNITNLYLRTLTIPTTTAVASK
jgi:hypothetical protein